MRFNKVIILGTGKLAVQCAREVQDFNIPVAVYDTNQAESSLLRHSLQKKGVVCTHSSAEEITNDLMSIKDRTLIISAVNPYIIPKKVLGKPNLLAINCHYALLPKHPGRNAEAWAIYEGDKETGITWHLMTQDIDSGDIISQKSLSISETDTSLKLLRSLEKLAFQSFCEFLPILLNNNHSSHPQDIQDQVKTHFSWEVPNEGFLDPEWPADKISAFLRAMDYGIVALLGKPKLMLEDKCYNWSSYRIENKKNTNQEDLKITDSSIIINKGNYQFSLISYSQVYQ